MERGTFFHTPYTKKGVSLAPTHQTKDPSCVEHDTGCHARYTKHYLRSEQEGHNRGTKKERIDHGNDATGIMRFFFNDDDDGIDNGSTSRNNINRNYNSCSNSNNENDNNNDKNHDNTNSKKSEKNKSNDLQLQQYNISGE